MFERNDTPEERAQVGIGTLIVFIAMVLVAAIAAGVLINTAGFLQSSAEESGQQAAEQVTNRLVEVSTVGTVSTGQVTSVAMTVRLAPGSNDVDVGSVTMQWVQSGGSYNLVSDTVGTTQAAVDGTFTHQALRDDDGSISADNTLNDPIDRAVISVDLTSVAQPMNPGESAQVTISTESGGETTVTLVVPDSLSGKSTVQL